MWKWLFSLKRILYICISNSLIPHPKIFEYHPKIHTRLLFLDINQFYSQTKPDGKIQSMEIQESNVEKKNKGENKGCLIMLWIFPSLSNLIQITDKNLVILITQLGHKYHSLCLVILSVSFPSTYLSQKQSYSLSHELFQLKVLCFIYCYYFAKSGKGIALFWVFS